eukprot:COSAG02_NODE_4664_length_5116_cov_9.226430_2_plen_77_part_00
MDGDDDDGDGDDGDGVDDDGDDDGAVVWRWGAVAEQQQAPVRGCLSVFVRFGGFHCVVVAVAWVERWHIRRCSGAS